MDRQPFKHLVLQVGPRESLGLSIMEVDDELLDQTAPALRPSGRLLVDEVVPGSPAERAGVCVCVWWMLQCTGQLALQLGAKSVRCLFNRAVFC